jgi:hypothetical protein
MPISTSPDERAVHHRAMSDRDARTDQARHPRVDVNHGPILHVAARPDADRIGVSPITALYHTLLCAPSCTWPRITAPGAMKTLSSINSG